MHTASKLNVDSVTGCVKGEPNCVRVIAEVRERQVADRDLSAVQLVTFALAERIHGAFTRGYDVTLVGDAHTTEDLTDHGAPPPEQVVSFTNLYWSYQTAPGRTASVVPSGDVTFS